MSTQVQEGVTDSAGRGARGGTQFLRRLATEKPLGSVGAVITVLLLLTGIFADLLAPYGFNETEAGDFLEPPSRQFWLGTDNLGRDVLSRVIYGARISMIVGIAATAVSTLIATAIGVLCGYLGGKFDLIVQRFVDGWMCLPYLPILMVVMAIVGPGMLGLIIVMGCRAVSAAHASRAAWSSTSRKTRTWRLRSPSAARRRECC